MDIEIKRTTFTPYSTIGEMSIDGKFECYTLEDVIRPAGEKVYGKTAIPVGIYRVVIDDSPHFGRPMPHILQVPGFEGIRIHAGNTAVDTEGCILVGRTKGENRIGESRAAFASFFPQLEAAGEATLMIS